MLSRVAVGEDLICHSRWDWNGRVERNQAMEYDRPLVAVIDGNGKTDEALECAAWTVLAEAVDDALTVLGPCHPHRHEFLTLRRDFLHAAGELAPQPRLRSA